MVVPCPAHQPGQSEQVAWIAERMAILRPGRQPKRGQSSCHRMNVVVLYQPLGDGPDELDETPAWQADP